MRESMTHSDGTVYRCKDIPQMSDETQTRCNRYKVEWHRNATLGKLRYESLLLTGRT